MFDFIKDFFIATGTLMSPFAMVRAWQGGVILRFGRWHRTLSPGYYWKIPFFEDYVLTETCDTTLRLQPQSLMTKDDVSVVVSSIVKYAIRDVRKYVCDVYDQKDVLADTTMGSIAKAVREHTYEEMMQGEVEKDSLTAAKRGAGRYGFEVLQLTLTDRARAKALRLVIPSNIKDLDN